MIKRKAVVVKSCFVIEELVKKTLEEKIEIFGRLCYKSEDKITGDSAIGFVKQMVENRHNAVLEMAVMSFFADVQGYFSNFEHWDASVLKYLVIDDCEGGILITGSVRAFREAFYRLPDDELLGAIALNIWQNHPVFFYDHESDLKKIETTYCNGQNKFTVREVAGFELEELQRRDPRLYFRHKHVAVRFIVNRAVTHELVRHRPCSFLQESQRYCRYSRKKFGERVTFIKPMFYDEGTEEYAVWEQSVLQAEVAYLKLLQTSTPQAARTVLPNSCKTEIIVLCSLEQWGHVFHLRDSSAAEPSMQEVMTPLYKEFTRRFFSVSKMLKERIPEGNS